MSKSTVVAELAMWSAEADRLAGMVHSLKRRIRLARKANGFYMLCGTGKMLHRSIEVADLLDLRKPLPKRGRR